MKLLIMTVVTMQSFNPIGAIGTYALVAVTTINKLWYKNPSGPVVEVEATTDKELTIKVGSSNLLCRNSRYYN